MNTKAIRAYAHAIYKSPDFEGDGWYEFDSNWDMNIWIEELDGSVHVDVYPVIDGHTITQDAITKFVLEV
jgi:hypothetical protein